MVKVQEVTFTKQVYFKGNGCDYWNVDLNGKPFGIIRKFRDTRTCKHPFVAIANSGEFAHKRNLSQAMLYMRGLM